MKRPFSESASTFPVAKHKRPSRFMVYGNICVDCALQVPTFPKEDSSQRAQSFVKKLGGNGANSCTVLAQLVSNHGKVSILGIIPEKEHPDAIFATTTLDRYQVDSSLVQSASGNIEGLNLPTSFVLLSADSGARTIVSSRCGLREMDVSHFQDVLSKSKDIGWCHLEFRQPGIPQMLELLKDSPAPVSLEVEKPSLEVQQVLPLLRLCDVCFFSSDWIRARANELEPAAGHSDSAGDAWRSHVALRSLEAMAAKVQVKRALLICPWGSLGAFALDTVTGCCFFQAAEKVQVVDSLGAGDTFIAASICALAFGAGPQETLRCACLVAGRKVAQGGLENLAMPDMKLL